MRSAVFGSRRLSRTMSSICFAVGGPDQTLLDSRAGRTCRGRAPCTRSGTACGRSISDVSRYRQLVDLLDQAAMPQRVKEPKTKALVETRAGDDVAEPQQLRPRLKAAEHLGRMNHRLDEIPLTTVLHRAVCFAEHNTTSENETSVGVGTEDAIELTRPLLHHHDRRGRRVEILNGDQPAVRGDVVGARSIVAELNAETVRPAETARARLASFTATDIRRSEPLR